MLRFVRFSERFYRVGPGLRRSCRLLTAAKNGRIKMVAARAARTAKSALSGMKDRA